MRFHTSGKRKIKEYRQRADIPTMEIGPIAGIRVAAVDKVCPAEPILTARFEIESLTNPADDCYASGDGNPAEESDLDSSEEEEITNEPDLESTTPNSQIDFFV